MTTNTETWGTFRLRIESLFSPTDVHRIHLAYMLAKYAHRAQQRKSGDTPERFFEHPRHVALNLLDNTSYRDPDMVIACLLHDGVEDTDELVLEMLEVAFGLNPATMVNTLTRKLDESFDGYVDRFGKVATIKERICKACDNLHNLRSLEGTDLAFRKKAVGKAMTYLNKVFTNIEVESTLEDRKNMLRLVDLILAEITTINAQIDIEEAAA